MEIGDWSATRDLNDCYREIRKAGLETAVAELEAFGFTVIENAISSELVERLKSTIMSEVKRRSGREPDLDTGEGHPGMQLVQHLLFKDRAFEEVVIQPGPLALITYLLGQSCLLSTMASHTRGPGPPDLPLHSDMAGNGTPTPFPAYAQVANCNYALTDYTGPESGCFAVVPGSHKLCRHPLGRETSLGSDNPDVVPVEVPAGSAIIFHGNTWHGSWARQLPGFRVNLAVYFHRRYMEPQELFRDAVPQELLDRNGPRFARLVGMDAHHQWGDEGTDFQKMRYGVRASRSQHA